MRSNLKALELAKSFKRSVPNNLCSYSQYHNKVRYLALLVQCVPYFVHAESLAWRQTNNMDTIDEEDWSYFERGYAYSVDTNDKRGQPRTRTQNLNVPI